MEPWRPGKYKVASRFQISIRGHFSKFRYAAISSPVPPHAYYIAPIASLYATQSNLGGWEVAKKGANDTPPYGKDAGYYPYNGLTPTSPLPGGTPGPNYDAYMLGQTTPVVIGPGGKMYATDKQHTDFAVYQGYKGTGFNPYAYILVTANYSNMTQAQFAQTMTDKGLVLLENNGQPETFAQLPGSLLNVGSDPYRALQYEVIKNKYPNSTVATVVGSDKAAVPYFEFLVGDAYRNGRPALRYGRGRQLRGGLVAQRQQLRRCQNIETDA